MSAELGLLVGIAAGGLNKYFERKKEKKQEAREDERFELYKELKQGELKNTRLQKRLLKMEMDKAERMGQVFTPEEEAQLAEQKARLEAKEQELSVALDEKKLGTFDEDRALEMEGKRANIGYLKSMASRMASAGSGGGAGVTPDGGIDIATQRRLSAMTERAELFQKTHMQDDGTWDSEANFNQWQAMMVEIDREFATATGLSAGTPPAPGTGDAAAGGAAEEQPVTIEDEIRGSVPDPIGKAATGIMSVTEPLIRLFAPSPDAIRGSKAGLEQMGAQTEGPASPPAMPGQGDPVLGPLGRMGSPEALFNPQALAALKSGRAPVPAPAAPGAPVMAEGQSNQGLESFIRKLQALNALSGTR